MDFHEKPRNPFLVRTVIGDLPRGSHGTVLYELENLGRILILVRWDTGMSVLVFPDEIELEPEHRGRTASPSGEQPSPARSGGQEVEQRKAARVWFPCW